MPQPRQPQHRRGGWPRQALAPVVIRRDEEDALRGVRLSGRECITQDGHDSFRLLAAARREVDMGRIVPALTVALLLVLPGCRPATTSPAPAMPTVQPVTPTATSAATPPSVTAVPTVTPTQAPTWTIAPPVPTLPRAVDCGKSVEVSAWEDQNANGIRDYPHEPPLSGVAFVLIDRSAHAGREMARGTTGADGTGLLLSPLISCTGKYEFEVYAKPPVGYQATTPLRRPAPVFSTFEVGFVKEP
jgi:hypothetical protein